MHFSHNLAKLGRGGRGGGGGGVEAHNMSGMEVGGIGVNCVAWEGGFQQSL